MAFGASLTTRAGVGAAFGGDGAGAVESPRAVTRGESSSLAKQTDGVKVDWLNCTFEAPSCSIHEFIVRIGETLGRPVCGTEGKGVFGFTHGVKLSASVGSRSFPIGMLAFGGESQRGRWMLQITGAGCSLVQSWASLAALLAEVGARLTRVDLAVDFLDGQYTVDDAVQMHRDGAFNCGGRNPSTSVAGDWLENKGGRTLYVGKTTNGKLLRVYEKGKQLGNAESDWVRFEVQLGNRDREIPLDVLLRPDAFLAGCYPALASMLEASAERIATDQEQGAVTLDHLMFHLKRSYGKLIGLVSDSEGFDGLQLVEQLRVIGAPRRVSPSAAADPASWAQVFARIQRMFQR